MKNYLELDIPNEEFLKVNIDYFDKSKNNTIMTYYPIREVIQEKVLQRLNAVLDVPINLCILFCTQPSFTLNIHKDTGTKKINDEQLNTWAINFVINSCKSEMIWYNEKPGCRAEALINPINSAYYHIDPSNVVEIERFSITKPTLVRTDILHNVENQDNNNSRYCVSIRQKNCRLTWEDAYNKFLNFNYNG